MDMLICVKNIRTPCIIHGQTGSQFMDTLYNTWTDWVSICKHFSATTIQMFSLADQSGYEHDTLMLLLLARLINPKDVVFDE